MVTDDLGRIDLLVREGFYTNRSDLIRAAIRAELDRNKAQTEAATVRHSFDLGIRAWSRDDLLAVQAAGQTLDIKVLGLAILRADIDPTLARATIARITVLGTPAGVRGPETGAGRPAGLKPTTGRHRRRR